MSRVVWVVVLAFVGGVAGCGPTADVGLERNPAVGLTEDPTPSADPAEVAETALLQAADFEMLLDQAGSGWDSPGPGSNHGWLFAIPYCPSYRAADYPARTQVVAARDGVYGPTAQRMVIHVVERYAPGWAARGFAEVRRVLAACGQYEYRSGNAGFTERLTVRQTGFAGEESLLVDAVQTSWAGQSYHRHLAVVRRGDLVATIAAGGLTAGEVRALAERAARRLDPPAS